MSNVPKPTYLAFLEETLTGAKNALGNVQSKTSLFAHLRSIAIPIKGRKSLVEIIEHSKNAGEEARHELLLETIERSLETQYEIEPSLRTYNELLIAEAANESVDDGDTILSVAFTFDGTDTVPGFNSPYVIPFDKALLWNMTAGLNLAQSNGPQTLATKKDTLLRARWQLGLGDNIQKVFSIFEADHKIQPKPDEVRYALQILGLWANTMSWSHIYTFHSKAVMDSLTALVLTIATEGTCLEENQVGAIRKFLAAQQRRKSNNFDFGKYRTITNSLTGAKPPFPFRSYERQDNDLKVGELSADLSFPILHRLTSRFNATNEGEPESYSFILGHPGFIARPNEIRTKIVLDDVLPEGYKWSDNSWISYSKTHSIRDKCEGGLERLNIIDLLDRPDPTTIFEDPKLLPVEFPLWARTPERSVYEYPFALKKLSQVHQELVVFGMACRRSSMVFKSGDLRLVFDGSWMRIKLFDEVLADLDVASNSEFLRALYGALILIAYGPSPRSMIVTYVTDENALKKIEKRSIPLHGSTKDLLILATPDDLVSRLLRATRTDGTIIVAETNRVARFAKKWSFRRDLKFDASCSGTGDAAAESIAKIKGVVSFKVSRDGGLKIRKNGVKGVCVGHETLTK